MYIQFTGVTKNNKCIELDKSLLLIAQRNLDDDVSKTMFTY